MKNVSVSLFTILLLNAFSARAEDLPPPPLPEIPEIASVEDAPQEAYKSMPAGSFPPDIKPAKEKIAADKVKAEIVKKENAKLPDPADILKADATKTEDASKAANSPPPLPSMDQFFSDTPLPTLAPYKEVKKNKEIEAAKIVKKVKPAPKFVKRMVKLSPEIYSASYDVRNTHLPKAVYHESLEKSVISAVRRGDVNALIALKDFGVGLDGVSDEGEPVLVIAARYGHTQTVKYLLQQKIWVDSKDANGLTALHYASFLGFNKMVDALLQAGANPNQADNRGVRPVTFARKAGHLKTAELLFRRGATS